MFKRVKEALLEQKMSQMRTGFRQPVIDGYSGFIFLNGQWNVFSPGYVDSVIKSIVNDYNLKETERSKEQNREPALLPTSQHIISDIHFVLVFVKTKRT